MIAPTFAALMFSAVAARAIAALWAEAVRGER